MYRHKSCINKQIVVVTPIFVCGVHLINEGELTRKKSHIDNNPNVCVNKVSWNLFVRDHTLRAHVSVI